MSGGKIISIRMISIRDARRVMLAALACILPHVLIACNEQPRPPMITGGTQAVKADPFDAGAGVVKSAPAADVPPAAPAKTAVTEVELGIPFYPGALPFGEPGNAPDSSMAGKGINAVLLQTSDSMDKVVAFYQEKLTGPGETGKPAPPSRRDGDLDGKPTVTLSRINGRTIHAAAIRQSNHLTMIELMSMEAPVTGKTNLPGNISGAASTGTVVAPGGIGSTPSTSPMSSVPGTPGTPIPGTQQPKRSLPYP
jgi:hypothetical protein